MSIPTTHKRKRDEDLPLPSKRMLRAVLDVRSSVRVVSESPIPAAVKAQEGSAKTNVYECLGGRIDTMLPGCSDVVPQRLMPTGEPLALITFACNQRMVEAILECFGDLRLVGLTPTWLSNTFDFPVLLDHSGTMARSLGLSDPVGGGVFPQNAVVFYNGPGKEVCRVRLDYDANVMTTLREVAVYMQGR